MEEFYVIRLNEQPVGKMGVQTQGLYYRFCGRCSLNKDGIYRAEVICGAKRENLGVLIPDGECFRITKTIPKKRIGTGDMSFRIITDRPDHAERFVPILPDEPFSYISRLKDSFLEIQQGKPGIIIRKEQA